MTNSTKDPHSVCCRRCGAELVWEHPKDSGHYQESSDYIGGDLCRSCLTEQRAQASSTDPCTSRAKDCAGSTEQVQFTLFQAPHAALDEHGLLMKMHDSTTPFNDPVPAQYYMPVFQGLVEVHCSEQLDPDERKANILEQFFVLYNRDDRPNPMPSRRLSIGDVVRLEGQYYLCAANGFTAVQFETMEWPTAEEASKLVMPNGEILQVSIYPEDDYPSICVDLVLEGGEKEHICFVEHNPERASEHQLCIGVYCADQEDTVYYDSYHRDVES